MVQAPNPKLSLPVNTVHLSELFLDASDASASQQKLTSPSQQHHHLLHTHSPKQGTYEYSLTFSCNNCRWTACMTSERLYFHSADIFAFCERSFESLLLQKWNRRWRTDTTPPTGTCQVDLQLPLYALKLTILHEPEHFFTRTLFQLLKIWWICQGDHFWKHFINTRDIQKW